MVIDSGRETLSYKAGEIKADASSKPDIKDINITLDKESSKPLPVTLLSGFLGSGKTTLLEHILQSSDHGLRIAVIVNDMSSLNIDATLITHHTVSHTKESLIQLQNGCICCTLRGDLLSELARLTTLKEVEYVVIESTGISEPMQVAETFTAEFSAAMVQAEAEGGVLDEEGKKILHQINTLGGLHHLSTLDTTVTVIDAFNLLSNLDTTDFLSDRYGADTIIPEDERTISDLMVDQIEFADVILINKMDMLASRPHDRDRIMRLVTTLNPSAKVLQTSYSRVDVKEILGTGRFDFLKAASGAGWLRSLHEMSKLRMGNGEERWAPTPETLEYGINNFVYTARRPFHPRRLYNLLHDKFIILQNAADDSGADHEEEEDQEQDATAESDTEMHSDSEVEEEEEEDPTQPTPQEILANKRAHPLLQPLLRSKGFFWLATRPYQFGEWSQAGAMLTLNCGGPWFAEVPDEAWPEDGDVRKSIEEDFQGEWGDRRQEIVFIGEGVDVDGVTGLLNECLLSTKEMKRWEKVMRGRKMERGEKQEVMAGIWEDGWEEWPAVDEEYEDEVEDEDDENNDVEEKTEEGKKKRKISEFMHGGHAHHGHSHKHK
ncbi:hypothetical protein ASPACDRAFT_55459 [Aspergillus aculeatus ATCC 16872]|uniref:CobW C-terminal domain-containing protein n=1 Tax=Aspergillus aculeatus (strain ATCC 16872 / CBS 172.66 / WB 5094) TaxID=690307 RepID=A0A1L9WG60_ASPA1|nr:uncharacterized protein ASPACDRAFT_55459 [Aspergillus aculeatus ATCC 16872]OJJ95156.1 hypothetical protein ASPACDRAFT_55459 [Aspergillus aculeatus ATCC 16872]